MEPSIPSVFHASRRPGTVDESELLELLGPQFEEQLRQYKEEDSFIELVLRAIQDRLTGQRPSMDVISEALHMSPRTLQRRLQEPGSNFQRVLDEARRQMARYYLSNSVLELNEAAYLLGFEDPNSFGPALFVPGKACAEQVLPRFIEGLGAMRVQIGRQFFEINPNRSQSPPSRGRVFGGGRKGVPRGHPGNGRSLY